MRTMAKEIERKFLVTGNAWRAAVSRRVAICQFYLFSAPDRSLRVRIVDADRAVLTVKVGTQALVRDEFEYDIPLDDAAAMRRLAVGHAIEKTRYFVDHDDHTYEIDVFEGRLAGLVLAELETPEARAVKRLPSWLGREVTGDPAYYNSTLAERLLADAAS